MTVAGAVARRANYYRRVVHAYVRRGPSQLTFWHEEPEINQAAFGDPLQYYMTFRSKADYSVYLDPAGVPLLDYGGSIGKQHNPIAIAQYGLGNGNLLADGDESRRPAVERSAAWLVANLRANCHGVQVWMHDFDWDYRSRLIAPWYSGLAQGQGISLLVRAAALFQEESYMDAADRAFESMLRSTGDGGVLHYDGDDVWIEEYLVEPPTHILNGFMWGLWGVYDYGRVRGSEEAKDLFDVCVRTLERNLHCFDTGWWSLYELSGTRLPMVASNFYHRLHIVQLQVMARLTGKQVFDEFAARWRGYFEDRWKRRRAGVQKLAFKLVHY